MGVCMCVCLPLCHTLPGGPLLGLFLSLKSFPKRFWQYHFHSSSCPFQQFSIRNYNKTWETHIHKHIHIHTDVYSHLNSLLHLSLLLSTLCLLFFSCIDFFMHLNAEFLISYFFFFWLGQPSFALKWLPVRKRDSSCRCLPRSQFKVMSTYKVQLKACCQKCSFPHISFALAAKGYYQL